MKKARMLLRLLAPLPAVSVFILLSFCPSLLNAQGRVLINEYLAWPGQDCGNSSEFVELFNFGPGPVDIGCWVLTDGDYAITIPANTVLLPGKHYVLAGRNVIPVGCANLSRTVIADLNWNNGLYTNATIPAGGFLTDGGGAGEQLVLFNAAHEVIDAIARYPEPSSSITTRANATCGGWTFDLDDMNIRYELIGESQGRNNSYARRIDGGCGWLKDTHQSAGDENNTPGNVPLFSASLSVVHPLSCQEKGYAVVHILQSNYAGVFPMKYLLARDVDSNGVYNESDHYVHGIDSVPSNIELGELESGIYRVVVETNNGCDLQSLDFNILDCNSALLSVPIRSFRLSHNLQSSLFQWELNPELKFTRIQLQASYNGSAFVEIFSSVLYQEIYSGKFADAGNKGATAYRIVATDATGQQHLSAVLRVRTTSVENRENLSVYTGRDGNIQLQLYAAANSNATIQVINNFGGVVLQRKVTFNRGINTITIPSISMTPGVYIMQIAEAALRRKPVRFVYTRY